MQTQQQTQKHIADNLRALGVKEGGVMLVHSSLRSLGVTPGGAETVVCGMLDALGRNGTLLMPALSYESVGAHNPIFDHSQTPSCVGGLTEYFRTRPGTIRSIHPTHSVSAFGPQAEELCKNHHLDTTPCGNHSPFSLLRGAEGQILFLGCGLKPNTSIHAIEEHVIPPYLFGESVDYRIILEQDHEMTIRVTSHDFTGWAQRYDRLGPILDEDGLKRGKVLEATAYLIDCRQMWQQALKTLKKDALFFVEKALHV
jgi:aminoglycoside 3-N-acetyltransferase